MSKADYIKALSEFLAKTNHTVEGRFEDVHQDEFHLWAHLIEEEAAELTEALVDKDKIMIADGISDLLYVVFGAGVALSLPVEELFVEVHRSNLTKACGDITKRADGKILKPLSYEPPDIEGVLEKAQSSKNKK